MPADPREIQALQRLAKGMGLPTELLEGLGDTGGWKYQEAALVEFALKVRHRLLTYQPSAEERFAHAASRLIVEEFVQRNGSGSVATVFRRKEWR